MSRDFMKIMRFFESMGKEVSLHPDLRHWHCKQRRNPILSPVLLAENGRLSSEVLRTIENHFRLTPGECMGETSDPYLVLTAAQQEVHQVVLAESGWEASGTDQMVCWSQPPDVLLDPRYVFSTRMLDASAWEEVQTMSKKNVGYDDEFYATGRNVFLRNARNILVTSVRDSHGELVASGMCLTFKSVSYLLWGSVIEKHRLKGLWKQLFAERMLQSARLCQAEFWFSFVADKPYNLQSQNSQRRFFYKKKLNTGGRV